MTTKALPSDSTSMARQVLHDEAQALSVLAEQLPEDFDAVVGLILKSSGRVAVGGVGKSGHVARKIAATLASTGTPSFFIHATEASHGDLGMMSRQDILLLISNSGETSELRDLIQFSRRFSIPLIGLSSRADSTLMNAADHQLLLPQVREACPLGLAPMSSTTMTMALGDALAASLMAARGFQSADFGALHPGGRLGARLALVSEYMHGEDLLPLVDVSASMHEAVLTITQKGFGITGVIEGGKLVGVITDGDLRRRINDLFDHTAGAIAHPNPITVRPGDLAAEALATLEQHKISALMVVDDEQRPVAVLHIHDLLRGGVA